MTAQRQDCACVNDPRMPSEKALEPAFLPSIFRNFLEALRVGRLAEAYLLTHSMRSNGIDMDSLLSSNAIICYANAMRSPNLENGAAFLSELGTTLTAADGETLFEYFLLSSMDGASSMDSSPLEWLLNAGFSFKKEGSLAGVILKSRYPEQFAKNLSLVERAAIDELLSNDAPEVREASSL